MAGPGPRAELAAYIQKSGEHFDPALANLLAAREEYPELQPGDYLARLDRLADDLGRRLQPWQPREFQIDLLNAVLFDDLGLRGNDVDYYDPRNSYVNEVLDRRLGLPITLSLVYLAVGRRAGLPLEGVGLPGHFVVRCAWPTAQTIVDPFFQGVRLTVDACRERVRVATGQDLPFDPDWLRPVTPRQMLARMLANLKAAYLRLGDLPRALRTVEQLLVVTPDSAHERRDRGLLRARLGQLKPGLDDLDTYLADAPTRPDAQQVRGQRDLLAALYDRRN